MGFAVMDRALGTSLEFKFLQFEDPIVFLKEELAGSHLLPNRNIPNV